MKLKLLSLAAFCLLCIANSNAQQWDGYTLIASQNSTTATLVDTNSTVYHSWTGLTGSNGYSAYLLSGGVLLRTVTATNNTFNGGGKTGRFQKVSWSGSLLWDVTYSSSAHCMHHDVLPMPNGNVMIIAWEAKTATQATANGSSVSHTMWPDKIVELHQTGATTYTVAWEWHAWDHVMQSTNASAANYVTSLIDNPQLLNINYKNTVQNSDWLHMNGLDYNEALDQVVVSSHNMNEFYIIDHSTTTAEAAGHTGGNGGKGGDFLYRWGNPLAYGGTGSANFNVIHDAHWVPAGCPRAGYIAGFNNSGVSNSQNAVDIVNPPISGYNYTRTAGQAYGPSTYDYRYISSDYSSNMGNSEQYPNGNMLVCVALSRKVYEVNAAGATIWTYTATGNLPQAHRYSNCFINGPQALTASSQTLTVCEGSPVQLTSSATGLGTYSYAWSSGGTTANISVTPTDTTTYTVTATLVSGCSATSAVTINVNPNPGAAAGNDVNITSGNSTMLTATGGTGFLWSNNATTASTTVSPTQTTTYTVTVTNASGCTATDEVVVNVVGGNLSATASANPAAVCEGESVQLNVAVSGGTGTNTYSWSSSPVGFTSALPNPVVSPATSTTYTVTVSDGVSTVTSTVSVSVSTLPTAGAGNDTSIAFGTSAALSASGGTTFLWSNGDNTATITVQPNVTTTYTVTVTNSSGCSATDAVVVTVTGGVLSAVVAASDTIICNGETTQLFVTASGGSGSYGYSWSSAPSGFTSTLYNPYVAPTVTTTYIVNVSDGVNTTAVVFTVTVLDLPTQPVITQNDTLLVSSSATNNQWYYYGSLISNATGQVLDPDLTGSYQVQVTDANGCGSPLSDAFEYIQTTGISYLDLSTVVSLYPNPASTVVMLDGKALQNDFELSVFDQTGRVVWSGKNEKTIRVSSLNDGVYFLAVQLLSGEKSYKRFVVSK